MEKVENKIVNVQNSLSGTLNKAQTG